jgi:hypothetical protein
MQAQELALADIENLLQTSFRKKSSFHLETLDALMMLFEKPALWKAFHHSALLVIVLAELVKNL